MSVFDSPPPDDSPPPADDLPEWKQGLAPELRDSLTLKDLKTVEDLAKKAVHAERAIGSNIPMPAKDASEEDWRAFWTRIGAPEKKNGYAVPEDGMPAGVKIEDRHVEAFREMAHRIGLTTKQFAAIARHEANMIAQGMTDAEAANKIAVEEAKTALTSEWGDAYRQNVDLAKQGIEKFGGKDLMEAATASGIIHNPTFLKAMAKIGRLVSEDEVLGSGRSTFVMTPQEAKDQIGKLKMDEAFMRQYLDGNANGHKEAVVEMTRLSKLAHPEKQPASA